MILTETTDDESYRHIDNAKTTESRGPQNRTARISRDDDGCLLGAVLWISAADLKELDIEIEDDTPTVEYGVSDGEIRLEDCRAHAKTDREVGAVE